MRYFENIKTLRKVSNCLKIISTLSQNYSSKSPQNLKLSEIHLSCPKLFEGNLKITTETESCPNNFSTGSKFLETTSRVSHRLKLDSVSLQNVFKNATATNNAKSHKDIQSELESEKVSEEK